MKQSELTPKQAKWIQGVQKALSKPGAEGLGFYTIGDTTVFVYDKTKQEAIDEHFGGKNVEFCQAVAAAKADVYILFFPEQVESTAG